MVRNETVLLGLNQLTDWGILTTDADLTITGWNRWLEINSGSPAADMIGRNLLTAIPGLATRRLDQFFHQALEGRVVLLAQRLHKYLLPMPPNADGGTLPCMQQSVRIAPLVQEERVVGTITVIEDVTERVVSDAELAARARQQAALAALGQQALAGDDVVALMNETAAAAVDALGVAYCAVWERTPDGRTLLLRAGVGWKEGTVGRATVEAGPFSHAGYTLGAGVAVLLNDLDNETRFPVTPLLKEHGVVSGLSVSIAAAERPLGVVGVYTSHPRTFSDDHIHFLQAAANVLGLAVERKRLEGELRQRAEQLAEADKRKDEFLAMLAHELRNPLAPIRNAAYMLRLKNPDDEELQFARAVIDRQLQHMTRLVDDLLDVSRISRGKVTLCKEPIELAAVVERALEISRPLIEARKHRLTVTLPPGPVFVDADLARLSQVVANLLNNAAKYTEERGRVFLTVARAGDEAILRVQDTGVGLAPDMLSSIFDLFTQAQGSVSRSEGGLGIGLSLVRSLVELHGGSVVALSEGIGRGSEFVIRLPLLKEVPRPLAAGRHPARSRKVPARRILVVDDNVDAAKSLALLLRLTGHEVRTAHDGAAALEAARAQAPDVVLLDIGLPRMDGLEVARRMREDLGLKGVVLVALTGYGQDEDRRRSEAAGFNAHLVKPIDLDLLVDLLV